MLYNLKKTQHFIVQIESQTDYVIQAFVIHAEDSDIAEEMKRELIYVNFLCNDRYLYNQHESSKKVLYCLYLDVSFYKLMIIKSK